MKRIAVGFLVLSVQLTFAVAGVSAPDPVGMYVLEPPKVPITVQGIDGKVRNLRVITEFLGRLKIRRINRDFFVVDLGGKRGYPSYNLGSFTQRLRYVNGVFVYSPSEQEEPVCRIIITISETAATVEQHTEDPNFYCGFGYGVSVAGIYKKVSSRVPAIKFPQMLGRL